MVKVFDNSVYRLRRIQSNLGSRIFYIYTGSGNPDERIKNG
jgi:hypothetical protein